MTDRSPGTAQLELIRRYARTLREMHADAMQARVSRSGRRRGGGDDAPSALAAQARVAATDVASSRPPSLPAS